LREFSCHRAGVKNKPHKPTRSKLTVFRQLCNLIPTHLVSELARQTGAALKARTYTPWSHVVAMLYAQFTHAIGLNDVCDGLDLLSGPLSAIRGATAPKRNTLAHANKTRPAEMAEKLFWRTLEHLRGQCRSFMGSPGQRRLHRFKVPIHIVDSTILRIVASAVDWKRHRCRKAAAKCHVRLNFQDFLPNLVIIGSSYDHDAHRAIELCAGLQAGEISLFDKAYADFRHLYLLDQRGVYWVTRQRTNLSCRVVKTRLRKPQGKILRDEEVVLKGFRTHRKYPKRFRRVVALVEVDGVEREMTFLTNNFSWAASTVAELYRARWQIEVFFKQIKQTLQLTDFLGNSDNAVRWQVWTALLVYVLLRYQAWTSQWSGSFLRLWACVRAALWLKLDVMSLLKSYGIAGQRWRLLAQPQQAYLPGFQPAAVG
jgi:DDE family transposase/uncharacterized protein DUF4372